MRYTTFLHRTIWQTFGVRVFSIYLVLYFLFISNFIAGNYYFEYAILKDINQPSQFITTSLMTLVNKVFLRQPLPDWFYFMGDNYWGLVSALTFMTLSVIIAFVWTLIDKGRHFPSLYKYVQVFARYYLAFVLLGYGLEKVDYNQFATDPISMLVRFGDNDRYHAFRSFMGISKSYKFFAGLIELIPFVLLLFRRTSTIGAMIALMVLTNVLILNIGYDIWLKLIIINLILFCIFIIIPDIKRLYQIFFLKQSAGLKSVPAVIGDKRYKWLQHTSKFLLIGVVVCMQVSLEIRWYHQRVNGPYKELVGVYDVKEFLCFTNGFRNDVDSLKWQKFALNQFAEMDVFLRNDSLKWFYMSVDTSKKILDLKQGQDTAIKGTLHYTNIQNGLWLFEGKLKNDSIRFISHRTDMYDMPVMKGYGKFAWLY